MNASCATSAATAGRCTQPISLRVCSSAAGGIARIAFVQQEHATVPSRVQQLDPDALRGELTNVADWFTPGTASRQDMPAPTCRRHVDARHPVPTQPTAATVRRGDLPHLRGRR